VVEIEAKVSSGTYIRTLAEDLGNYLGTGAYLAGLIRTEIGQYSLDKALLLKEADVGAVSEHLLAISM
jgi:tRNA pseudouridine55 synthase